MIENKKCNMCGKELNSFDVQQDFRIHKDVGYGSEFDGQSLDLSLCCECADRLIKSCAVSPIQETLMTEKTMSFEELMATLDELGVSLYGADGGLKPVKEVMRELAEITASLEGGSAGD